MKAVGAENQQLQQRDRERDRCTELRALEEQRQKGDKNNLTGSINRTELSLSILQLHHSNFYDCKVLVWSWLSHSAAVTVTIQDRSPLIPTRIQGRGGVEAGRNKGQEMGQRGPREGCVVDQRGVGEPNRGLGGSREGWKQASLGDVHSEKDISRVVRINYRRRFC
ncbi:unnamed protein product [Coccothraustes coccothraustes]